MKKIIYPGILTVIILLVTLLIVAIHSNMESQEPADTPDIATIKRLLSLGAEIWIGGKKESAWGIEAWSDNEKWYTLKNQLYVNHF